MGIPMSTAIPPGRVAQFCPKCGSPLAAQERYGKMRPVCPACGHVVFFDPKVAVVVFVAQNGAVLLIKRGYDPGKGRWALPAGFVDAVEDPQEAARREVLEETGLEVTVDRLLDVLFRPDDDGLADIVLAYAARVTGGTLQADDDAEAAAWFPADALPDIALVTTIRLIERWLAGAM
jgi:ADP-ribose pyrophosphatase YjhB (NUDIX family)